MKSLVLYHCVMLLCNPFTSVVERYC
uniref:Uncharacterized protein n=1 Tax=Rhizophora mucronata TaxID=61149 RepID=A0A2P2PYQ3_RHIMU